MIYSGTKENHSGIGAVIQNSKFNDSHQGTTYIGYMYNDDDLEVTTYPSSTPSNLNGYNLYSSINPGTSYYFTSTKPTCDTSKKTCSFTCKIGENCKYVTWSELNNNYDKTDSMSTSTVWKYTGEYKYTCFSNASVINNSDGSKNISCQLTTEIMGVVGNSNTPKDDQVKIKYYGVFSPSYESSTTNKTDSVIKTVVDNWYKENIYDKNLESYIVNQVFCNDRSISDKVWSVGNGYDWTTQTIYNPFYRMNYIKNPSLLCTNSNDEFTLKVDSLSSIKGTINYGNNALDYPVGLVTSDEVMLAGGLMNTMNSKFYINAGEGCYMWTASPTYNSDEDMRIVYLNPNGSIGMTALSSVLGVRPIINLKSNVTIMSGAGTINDPYIIK